MKAINFKKFEMFEDISHSSKSVVDVRQELADNLYKASNGIAALDLAMKIYKSSGPIEFNDQEFAILEEFAKTGTPRFIDSFRANVVEKPKDIL